MKIMLANDLIKVNLKKRSTSTLKTLRHSHLFFTRFYAFLCIVRD